MKSHHLKRAYAGAATDLRTIKWLLVANVLHTFFIAIRDCR